MERRNVLIVAAVIMAAVAVPIIFVALTGGEPSPSLSPTASASASSNATPSTSPSTSASPSPSASAAPSEPTGPIDVAWEPVGGLEPGAEIHGVSFIGGRWFALGQVSPEAAIWTSEDGRTWTRAEIASTRAENELTVTTGMAQLDGRLVAIGAYGAMETDQFGWMTWTSDDDGATWTEHRDEPSPYAARAITAGGPGLVAAIWEYSGTTPFDVSIAVSQDGISWELLSATLDVAEIRSLAVVGERIAAVGNSWVDGLGQSPTAWYSDDGGTTWTFVDVRGAGGPGTLSEVVIADDGFLAIGGGSESGAAAWVSADAETWERIDIIDGAEGRGLAQVEGGWVAVGNVLGQDIGRELSWTSVDGRAWEPGQEFGSGSVHLLGADGDGATTVVAGGRCVSQTCESVLWIGEVSR